MNIATLLSGLNYTVVQGTEDKEVSDIRYNSKDCKKGNIFFALYGRDWDGHLYIEDAIGNGADAVVFQNHEAVTPEFLKKWEDREVSFIHTDDTRMALALSSKIFWGSPNDDLLTIGVTGTKGKTTTTHMIKKILDDAGIKTGIIGTIKNGYTGHYEEGDNTTPESYQVYRMMRDMVDNGCKAVVMEVSSQGLKYHRVDGIDFDFGLVTNVSPDHIGTGEHTDFYDYFCSKKKLLQMCKTAVINMDDDFCRKMCWESGAEKIISYGFDEEAAYRLRQVRLTNFNGTFGIVCHCRAGSLEWETPIPLPGKYNGYNAVAAMTVCGEIGVDLREAAKSLSDISVRGRSEIVKGTRNYNVIIDYAHNGMSLKHLLETLREYKPERLIVVFGCGGERDKLRRYDMGKVATTYADYSIVTSDNPRNEDPHTIIEDIVSVMTISSEKYRVIVDRREAINFAIKHAKPGDTIVIAGKGHETYQIIGNEKRHFDDREVVQKLIN